VFKSFGVEWSCYKKRSAVRSVQIQKIKLNTIETIGGNVEMTKFDPKEYWENRLTQDFSLQGVGRIDLGRQYNNWLYRIRRKVFIDLIRSLKKDVASANILDIGSGTGFYIERWQEVGCDKIMGVDLTEVVVKRLSKKYPQHTFEQLDIGSNLSQAIEEHKFDIISCFDVLFHIVDDSIYQKAFENIY
jgi:2-polyprenyl-3-methyl-5-hydroxy-6-metoxy-1,4-benzoquinol methylase